ncbi:hypothetical protein [Bifidobacterium platyrrhinorum]|uniref:DUF559 domain-containing protein n=1 Tax=Bifidobacterium platyrrhinorum TaxID=2661628 RepID=A0A6L9STA5_9BIFI|nr:hypothetical protein [Bifidobacterium platyrrhinorum]NEG55788.1 hypothetical protein [Bifidobacterium platyrrhinorum]
MQSGIVASRRRERKRCNDAAQRTNAPLHVGYLNAIRYWGAPVPRECGLSDDVIHVSVPQAGMRKQVKGVSFHVFRGTESYRKEHYERFWVASPAMAWAQMANHCGVEDLAAIGAALLSRDRRRKVATLDELRGYVAASPRFAGRKNCLAALPYIVENTDSPPETALFRLLCDAGLGRPVPNHRVNLTNGYVLLDMAYPDCRVAFEYQGYHHADPGVMMADASRIGRLQANGWTIVYVTANDFRTSESKREFMDRARTIVNRQRYLAAFCTMWLAANHSQ